jgi:hypothetical protein
MKLASVALTLLAIASGPANAQPSAQSLPVLYNQVNAETSSLDREARKVYAGKFRIVEVTKRDDYTPGRMKGITDMFRDPRSMRSRKVPGKIVILYVVTADGRVIEPRVLKTTDRQASGYLVDWILVRRFVPARFRGATVASLHSIDMNLEAVEIGPNQPAQNGLGLGSGDR